MAASEAALRASERSSPMGERTGRGVHNFLARARASAKLVRRKNSPAIFPDPKLLTDRPTDLTDRTRSTRDSIEKIFSDTRRWGGAPTEESLAATLFRGPPQHTASEKKIASHSTCRQPHLARVALFV
jgi:hypothetical protein